MSIDFNGFSSAPALRYFEEISRIPRPSGHEEKIADYIENILRQHGTEYYRDAANNIFAVLPATPGREAERAVMLQGHMDMVCEADEGVEWDVLGKGVTLVRDGDWLHAAGTTLGGDDGFAVAFMLALLDGGAQSHPKLEFLFTTDEEVGLGGARAFDTAQVTAGYLVNLDAEDEHEVIVSCAGGVRTDMLLRYHMTDFDGVALRVTLSGLAGGHSGADIHLGRVNANRALAAALAAVAKKTPLNLAAFEGGTKDNAITRQASAIVSVRSIADATAALDTARKELTATLTDADSGMTLVCERTEAPASMLTRDDSRQALEFIALLPCGALEKNEAINITETSSNIGCTKLDGEGMHISSLSRSNDEKKLDNLCYVIEMLCVSYGAEMDMRSRYPAWSYLADSRLCAAYCEAFAETAGFKPRVCGIHAGLECGIFKKTMPDVEMISIGADIFDVHTPREKLSLSSADRVWQAILCLLSKKI